MPKVKDPINFDPKKAVSARCKLYESQREAATAGDLDVNVVRRAEDGSNLTPTTAIAYARLVQETLAALVPDSERARAEALQPTSQIGDLLVRKYHREQLHCFPESEKVAYADLINDEGFAALVKAMRCSHDPWSLRLAKEDGDESFDTAEEFDVIEGLWSTPNWNSHPERFVLDLESIWWPDENLTAQPGLTEAFEQLVSKGEELQLAADPKLDGSFASMMAALEHRSNTFTGVADLKKNFGINVYGALLYIRPRCEMALNLASYDAGYQELLKVAWRTNITIPIFFFSSVEYVSVPIRYTTIDRAAEQHEGLPF